MSAEFFRGELLPTRSIRTVAHGIFDFLESETKGEQIRLGNQFNRHPWMTNPLAAHRRATAPKTAAQSYLIGGDGQRKEM